MIIQIVPFYNYGPYLRCILVVQHRSIWLFNLQNIPQNMQPRCSALFCFGYMFDLEILSRLFIYIPHGCFDRKIAPSFVITVPFQMAGEISWNLEALRVLAS